LIHRSTSIVVPAAIASTPVQKRKKAGRRRVYETSMSFRTSWNDYALLNAIAAFERLEAVELLRMWLNQKRTQYRKDKGFVQWLLRHKDDADIKVLGDAEDLL
jgi:hypothetical protein